MADPKIEVIFGAQIAGLVAGVKEAEELLKGLVAPIEAIKTATSGMFEVVGLAFATEKIREFAVEMAELGEKTLNLAYVMGQSVGDMAQFQAMMTLSGSNADEAGQSLVRFARFIQNVEEGNKRAVATLHNLGMTEEEVRQHGDNLLPLFQTFLQHINELSPSFRNLGAISQEFGRGVLRLAGMMREGGEGWGELAQAAETYRQAMERNAEGMAETASAMNRLKNDTNTLAVDGFGLLKPLIDASVNATDAFVHQIMAALTPIDDAKNGINGIGLEIRNLIQGIRDVISVFQIFGDVLNHLNTEVDTLGKQIHAIFVGLFHAIVAIITGGDVEAALQQMIENLKAITKSGTDAMVGYWKDAAERIKAIFAGIEAPLGDVNLPPVDVRARRGGRALGTEGVGGGRGKDTTKSEYEAFAAEMRLEIAEADKDWAQISAIYDKWAAHAKEVFGAQSKEYREVLLAMTRAAQQHGRELFQQAEENYSATRSIDQSYLKAFEANLEEMVKKHQLSKQQMYGFDLQYAQQRYEIERKILENMIQNLKAGSNEALKVYLQMMELDAKHAAEVATYNEKMTNDSNKSWKELSDKISSQMSSALMDVIKGTESVGQAFKKMFLQITQDLLSSGIKDAFMSLLTGSGSGMFSAGGLLGGLFGAGGGAAGISSFLPMLFAAQRGGIIPSAAGGWQVPSFQGGGVLAQLHSNEMVLPAHISQSVQDMAARGGPGGSTNINIHAWDTQSGAQALMANKQAVAQSWRSAGLSNGMSYRSISSGGRYP